MRPKIVVLILLMAIALVVVAAVLKGLMGGHTADQEAKVPPPAPVEAAPQPVATPQVNLNSSNNADFVEQLRQAEIVKELDQIRELQAGGGNDPNTTSLLLAKVSHKEPEVRQAAVQALVQLNDTNAIPGLEQAQATADDPREKVVLMDAISYLKLPEMSLPPPDANATAAANDLPRTRPPTPRPRPQRGAGPGRPGVFPTPQPAASPAAPAEPATAPPQ